MRGRWRARRAACERRRRWELPALARSPRGGLGRLGHSCELGLVWQGESGGENGNGCLGDRVGQQLDQKEGKRRGELGLAAAVSVGRDERRGESRLGWFEEERKKDFPF